MTACNVEANPLASAPATAELMKLMHVHALGAAQRSAPGPNVVSRLPSLCPGERRADDEGRNNGGMSCGPRSRRRPAVPPIARRAASRCP
eukprot:58026-Chlamydomonas_euryale.AAC.12